VKLTTDAVITQKSTRMFETSNQYDKKDWMVVEKSAFKTLCKKQVIQNRLLLLYK